MDGQICGKLVGFLFDATPCVKLGKVGMDGQICGKLVRFDLDLYLTRHHVYNFVRWEWTKKKPNEPNDSFDSGHYRNIRADIYTYTYISVLIFR